MTQIGKLIKGQTEHKIPDTIEDINYQNYIWKYFQIEVTKLIQKKNPVGEFLLQTDDDNHFIGTLISYFAKNKRFYDSRIIQNTKSLSKGLLIIGNCGVGKTLTMNAFSRCNQILGYCGNNFKVTTCNNVVRRYDAKGQMAIDAFMEQSWYFDDFGLEDEGMNFGKKSDVMKLVIEERSDLFNRSGVKTHMSTNLVPDEIKERYGVRVYDRLFEMFNIIIYPRQESYRS
jgi:hypothetical protein